MRWGKSSGGRETWMAVGRKEFTFFECLFCTGHSCCVVACHPHNHPRRWEVVLDPFYTGGNRGSLRFNNLWQITQSIPEWWSRIQTLVVLTPVPSALWGRGPASWGCGRSLRGVCWKTCPDNLPPPHFTITQKHPHSSCRGHPLLG